MKDKHTTAEILRWYLYSGVDETIGEVPQNRFINVNFYIEVSSLVQKEL